MQAARTVTVLHSDLVAAVQAAMVDQLRRDGRLEEGMELGLTFYSAAGDDVAVLGKVRRGGEVLFELEGGRDELCALATRVALDRLTPEEIRQLQPPAEVHWRTVRFSTPKETMDRFFIDVRFQRRS